MSRPTLTNTLRRAAAAFSSNDYEAARDAAATAVAIAPDSVPAHHYLAASMAALGQPRAADRAFHEGLSLAPSDTEILLGLCDLLTGDLATEAAALEEALGLAQQGFMVAQERGDSSLELEFLLARVRALISLGRAPEALRALGDRAPKGHCDFFLQRGIARFESGALQNASDDFGAALAIEPEEPLAFWYQALISEFQGDMPRAARLAERARRLDEHTFPTPLLTSEQAFKSALEQASKSLEGRLHDRLSQATLEIQALPDPSLLGTLSPLATSYGLWEDKHEGAKILLFRRNLERQSRSQEELRQRISRGLRHALSGARKEPCGAALIPLFAQA